jgi:hypothetical protein
VLKISNAPRIVVQSRPRTAPCDLARNLKKLEQGCEIVSSVSASGARVTYTLSYPNKVTQTFRDTADKRGHSLHVFNVVAAPSLGTASVIVRVTVSAVLRDGTPLHPATTRFQIRRR